MFPLSKCTTSSSINMSTQSTQMHSFLEFNIIMYIYVRTLRKQVLQLHKLDGCTLHRMAWHIYIAAVAQHALQWFPLLCGVSSAASRSAFAVAGALPPPLGTYTRYIQHALQWFPLLCGVSSAASQSAFAIAGALPPPLGCALVQCAVASCSASVSSADSHSELPSSTNAR